MEEEGDPKSRGGASERRGQARPGREKILESQVRLGLDNRTGSSSYGGGEVHDCRHLFMNQRIARDDPRAEKLKESIGGERARLVDQDGGPQVCKD